MKVIWTREDDITHSFYRPSTYNVFRAALDATGKPTAWFTRAVGAGLLRQRGTVPAGQVDGTSMAGLRDLPYDIPNVRIEWVDKDLGVPVGFWRSVGSSQNAFIVETFVDELAHQAGQDPYEYRRALLGKSPRHKGVLELAATKAGWGTPLPAGRARGIAVCFSYASYSAHVAEVSVADDGAVRIHRLVCAIDCGIAVNPDQVKAQMEGGAVYAMTATLYGQITLDGGRVQQTNFHTYPMMRIAEIPRHRGAHPGLGPGAGRAGRARRAHGRAGRLQRDLRRHRQAHPAPADRPGRAQARVAWLIERNGPDRRPS